MGPGMMQPQWQQGGAPAQAGAPQQIDPQQVMQMLQKMNPQQLMQWLQSPDGQAALQQMPELKAMIDQLLQGAQQGAPQQGPRQAAPAGAARYQPQWAGA